MTAARTMTVVGEGFVAEFLAELLSEESVGSSVVLVAELNRIGDYQDIILECVAAQHSLLFVGTWRSFVYVGPVWRAGQTGCPHCLVTRTANSSFGPDLLGDTFAEVAARDLTVSTLGPGLLRIVELQVRACLADPDLVDGQVIVIDGLTGTVERQLLLPDSTCANCGESSTGTIPEFHGAPLPKLAPGALRTREVDARVIEREYLFGGLGLFKELRQDLQSPIGACSVELVTRWGRREPAIGRGDTFGSSRTIAVLEGLERYAGMFRGGRTAPVRAAYAEIADEAVYPPELGTHPAESYAAQGFRYQEFSPDTVVDWVWAYSFRKQQAVLIPERAAFWGPRHDGEISFMYDTSNGCALGNSPEEAILHGLREVAERDSFLLTWYRRLALPEVDLDGVGGRLGQLLRKAKLFTGFRFRAFQSTMEYGMPSFWLVAENSLPDGPRVLAGSGAHPDPIQAIIGGLHELIGSVQATTHSYPRRRADGLRMLADPTLIRTMADHPLVGALPEARPRYGFLLDRDGKRIALGDIASTLQTGESDLCADLDTALSGMLAAGLDVLAVDQTMPELRRNGLSCVRVLVPGTVPMTFGHLNRRVRGLPRLTGETAIPYRGQCGKGEEIGCVPHPFP
ncbi:MULTISPECIES: TOMM precursor leader peptide-binding protein [unclassified Nocardia]|uniref:TOMM precursor leader peptide-binding protein n=1 Tax=unclassified Nocardia TaxID=2637762 RepID=UPI001CE493E1|nr:MULTISPECIES: TOMM precursor leader peptide-binding protein [unclassified Nocardia]